MAFFLLLRLSPARNSRADEEVFCGLPLLARARRRRQKGPWNRASCRLGVPSTASGRLFPV